MKLETWINGQIDSGCATGKKDAYKKLAKAIAANGFKVSPQTIEHVARGMRLTDYRKAKAIEVATGGDVKAESLCEGS